MIDFKLVRSSVAAAVATFSDFLSVVGMVSLLGLDPVVATALGCVVGAAINFSMNRSWAFGSKAALPAQMVRYALVSLGSLVLNTAGVHLLLQASSEGYGPIWWLVRGGVWLGWNYPMHRYWVFR